jgi:hypothetical protein
MVTQMPLLLTPLPAYQPASTEPSTLRITWDQ